eukprot:6201641-Pleurochrysis_carterae.AAC.5
MQRPPTPILPRRKIQVAYQIQCRYSAGECQGAGCQGSGIRGCRARHGTTDDTQQRGGQRRGGLNRKCKSGASFSIPANQGVQPNA